MSKKENLAGSNNPNYIDGRTLKQYYCPFCGKILSSYQSKMCSSCASKKQWENFRKERPHPKCIDCGKKLKSTRAIRCGSCAAKKRFENPKNNPNYVDGKYSKKNYCIDCGLEISKGKSKRCVTCAQRKRFETESSPMKDKRHSKQSLIKMSNSQKGRTKPPRSKQHRKKLSISTSRALKGKCGKDARRYIDGRSSIRSRVHSSSEYQQWRMDSFKRDNYTCQECGERGGKLEVHHHKKPFAKILAEFLKIYDQFSPIEDKEILIRLAIKYKSFWDSDNGQTLCKDCHELTDNYKK